jgi:SNF2 family DNA or RNA helicase
LIADKFYEEKINQAKGIMNSFIMRRLKTEVLKDLPEKKCDIVICDMTRRQRDEYDILLNSYKQLKSDYLNKPIDKKSSTAKDNTKKVSCLSVLAALTELRVGFL